VVARSVTTAPQCVAISLTVRSRRTHRYSRQRNDGWPAVSLKARPCLIDGKLVVIDENGLAVVFAFAAPRDETVHMDAADVCEKIIKLLEEAMDLADQL